MDLIKYLVPILTPVLTAFLGFMLSAKRYRQEVDLHDKRRAKERREQAEDRLLKTLALSASGSLEKEKAIDEIKETVAENFRLIDDLVLYKALDCFRVDGTDIDIANAEKVSELREELING